MRVSGISTGFPVLSQSLGQVSHVILTRSPLDLPMYCYIMDLVRLACVKHAASVRPEPGSNSPSKPCSYPTSPEGVDRHESISEKSEREGLTSLNLEVVWFFRTAPWLSPIHMGFCRNCLVNDHDSYLLPILVPASRSANEHGEGRLR